METKKYPIITSLIEQNKYIQILTLNMISKTEETTELETYKQLEQTLRNAGKSIDEPLKLAMMYQAQQLHFQEQIKKEETALGFTSPMRQYLKNVSNLFAVGIQGEIKKPLDLILREYNFKEFNDLNRRKEQLLRSYLNETGIREQIINKLLIKI